VKQLAKTFFRGAMVVDRQLAGANTDYSSGVVNDSDFPHHLSVLTGSTPLRKAR